MAVVTPFRRQSTYWWPRRKLIRVLLLNKTNGGRGGRRCSSGLAEGRRPDIYQEQHILEEPTNHPAEPSPDETKQGGLSEEEKSEEEKSSGRTDNVDNSQEQIALEPRSLPGLDNREFEHGLDQSDDGEKSTKPGNVFRDLISTTESPTTGTFDDLGEIGMEDPWDEPVSYSSGFTSSELRGHKDTSQAPLESLDAPVSKATVQPQYPISAHSVVPELELEPAESKKIHVLGSGAVGKFLAHHMAELPFAPSITLLLHRPLLMQTWHDEGAAIRLLSHDGDLKVSNAFNIESSVAPDDDKDNIRRLERLRFGTELEISALQPSETIDSLLVTTEPRMMIPALKSIKHRLRPESTVCIIADGLGLIEQVNAEVFPDPYSRPHYMTGSISHVLQPTDRKFSVIQRSAGAIRLSMPQQDRGQTAKVVSQDTDQLVRRIGYEQSWPNTARLIFLTLCRQPQLNAMGLAQSDWLKSQLERLLINSILGPLTVMFDCSNDQLLYNYHANLIMIKLLGELCHVVQSFPELSHKAKQSFNNVTMQHQVLSVISRTGRNHTAMLRDVRTGERTDIDYFNGYLLKRAKAMGVHCPLNEMLVSMVKAKGVMKSHEKNSYIPFALREGQQ